MALLLSCRACAAACQRAAPAGPNRNGLDPTAEVEGRQRQTGLSMAATMCWRRLGRAAGREALGAATGKRMQKANHHRITKSSRQPILKNVTAPLTTKTM